jgi:glyoxylase-like metal-dependent hydrolase (beta-lactamase superfamily II)
MSVTLSLMLGLLLAPAPQEQDFSKVEIKTERVADGVYVLEGAGGNIGVSAGDDGVFLIDDEYAPLTDKIKAAIQAISDKPIRFLLNTHWHGDHTGGNENLGKAGVLIVASENVRKRMNAEQFVEAFGEKVPPAPAAALPVVTFSDSVTFHMNGDEIQAFHVAPAHTDGDAMIHFHKANVVHMGDVFFNGLYPFIDVSSGGNLDGMIAATDRVLAFADGATRIIPGHGPVGDRAALLNYRDMLAAVRHEIKPLIGAGKTRAEVLATKPTKEFDAKWGKGFIKPDVFAGLVYDGYAKMKASEKKP